MFHRTSHSYRIIFLAAVCLVLLASVGHTANEPASTQSPKIYSPFDEPKPKMPVEIQSDSRLDRRVDISVKSRNMKDLLLAIRKQTGVSVVVSRELAGERPMVFCHDKPLRDVMTEISELFGYYWLARGQKDAWVYELFEDKVHAKRREQVRGDRDAEMVDALLDSIEQASEALKSEAGMAQLSRTNPRLYKTGVSPGKQELLRFINLLDRPTTRSYLNDVGMSWGFTDMSSEMQAGVLKAINGEYLDRDPTFKPLTPERMTKAHIVLKRWRWSVFTAPHVMLVAAIPPGEDGSAGMKTACGWPAYEAGEPDLLSMAEVPAARVTGDPLPNDIKITIEKKHEVLNYGDILFQDVLEAIAEQANLNVIADYYYQPEDFPACEDEPLSKLIADLCLKMDYSCQVDGNTLRFRFNKWYLQPLQEEPTVRYQESLWTRITGSGALTLDDLLDIACLPGQQTYWGGFRFIPQAQQARLFPRTARLVRMLGDVLEKEAMTKEGLSVSKLDPVQFSRIVDWAQVMGIKETPEGLLKCTILLQRSGTPETNLTFTLVQPDGNSRNVALSARLEPFSEAERTALADERAAELASDKVELSAGGK